MYIYLYIYIYISKEFPREALSFPGGWGCPRFMTIGTWRLWLYPPAAFTPRKYFSLPLRGRVFPMATVRPEGLCQWKFPVTPSKIKPATFRLVAQFPNQLRHRVPNLMCVCLYTEGRKGRYRVIRVIHSIDVYPLLYPSVYIPIFVFCSILSIPFTIEISITR